ncbi:GNAT family N-acetyltransferase [Sulfitobacter sp. F26204]|uniref:GNAT family N-acetyltransferase n=1 Tax=Sulfitobacter sp. F26204 TaxID=2996014 RepID=UPI00225E564A|nr:GNAT family N-acetyltransferase [Sulfitobacter sp. F26204]MCX7559749.1 GNAT family N-acetyltransferase [Sulfitobacter sp. F26204]
MTQNNLSALENGALHLSRITLRRFPPGDAADVVRMLGHPDVSKWLSRVPRPYTCTDAIEFFDRHSTQNDLVFAITHGHDLIGGISLVDELGYWLGADHWGNGFASEAAGGLVAHYFSRSDQPVSSGYILGNTASRGVLNKLGFTNLKIEGTPSLALKQDVQVQKMCLTKSTWQARQ